MLTRRSADQAGSVELALSLGRQIELSSAAAFELGPLKVQPSTLQIEFGGRARTIEPRVMQALVVLANLRGTVVSRDRLLDLCWGRVVGEDAINRCMAKVRAIGAEAGAFEIETIPRVGHRLMVHELGTATAPKERKLRPLPLVVAALLLVAAAAGALWYLRGAAQAAVPAIAVASFTGLNTDGDAKLYAEEVSDAVSGALVDTGARLAPDDEANGALAELKQSGAALVVRGTVRRQDGAIRVKVSVESTRTGTPVFTRDFEASAARAAFLSDNVAASIASMMKVWIIFSRVDRDPEVAESILDISTLWGRESVKAVNLSRDLARSKGNSASAQAIFASTVGYWLSDVPLDERAALVSEARSAALRAGELNPRFGYVLPCMLTPPGFLVMTAQCDAAMRAAAAGDSDPPHVHQYLMTLLAQSGLFHEAEEFSDTALGQSPYDEGRLTYRIFVLEMAHPPDHENELPNLRARARRYWPDVLKDSLRFEAAVANGKIAQAEAILHDPLNSDGIVTGTGRDVVDAVFLALKTKKAADVAAAEAQCLPPPPNWNPPNVAFQTCLVGLTMLGRLDDAFELAERGNHDVQCCSPKDQEEWWLKGGGLYYPRYALFGSALAPMRADPRFIDIARRTGLLAYWASGHPPDFCVFERVPVCALLTRLSSRRPH